ncbi:MULTISPECIES: hypothetical protein [Rhodanobacter]|uniref:hypothetical protein n=1 Tax=Rhodanobacter TaxID=75309 RepID=UPI0009DBF35E|nr:MULTISPECIES: hypothetical protein [Rhodanobacter]TAN15924.1 MAG: hypothetical protein EPN35_11935 [Rhodanobacter sp.]UJJ53525.1 hypothetical protein LRK53_11060 [Rhodanobacter thiooxydans]
MPHAPSHGCGLWFLVAPITLVLYPMMLVAYVRLARREERDSFARFGPRYAAYMLDVPDFLPLRSHATQT